MAKTLYLIRHGITDWNAQRKMQGHTNVPLNTQGREQALGLKVFLQQNPIEKVFSSDLDRALQTARLSSEFEEITVMEGLREVRLGDIEGRTETEIVTLYGAEAWNQWTSWTPQANFAYPGGETHQESLTRFKSHLENIFKNHEFKKAAAYTHGLIIRRLAHHLCPHLTEPLMIPNCGVFALHWKEEQLSFEGLIFHP